MHTEEQAPSRSPSFCLWVERLCSCRRLLSTHHCCSSTPVPLQCVKRGSCHVASQSVDQFDPLLCLQIKSLWVTDWDLLMISSTPPVSTALSFLSMVSSPLSLHLHVLMVPSYWKLTALVPRGSRRVCGLSETHAFIFSCLYYCNALHSGMSQCSLQYSASSKRCSKTHYCCDMVQSLGLFLKYKANLLTIKFIFILLKFMLLNSRFTCLKSIFFYAFYEKCFTNTTAIIISVQSHMESVTVTHNNIIHRWNVYPFTAALLDCSVWVLAPHPLAVIRCPWHFPFSNPNTGEVGSSGKKKSGFGCRGRPEWVWSEYFYSSLS